MWAAKDDWERAHALVMDESGRDCAWIHAYLHRVEGDLGNAGYWYRQAGQPVAAGPLAQGGEEADVDDHVRQGSQIGMDE